MNDIRISKIKERAKGLYQTCNGYEWETDSARELTMLSDLNDLLNGVQQLCQDCDEWKRKYEDEKTLGDQLETERDVWRKDYFRLKEQFDRLQKDNEWLWENNKLLAEELE